MKASLLVPLFFMVLAIGGLILNAMYNQPIMLAVANAFVGAYWLTDFLRELKNGRA